MPRRNLLTPAERTSLLAFPATDDEFIQHYTFSESDLSVIRQRRGSHNRLGFAVQLCYLRYPGFALPTDAEPPASLLKIVGRQLRIEPDIWSQYAQRPETRREHLLELQAWLKLTPGSPGPSRDWQKHRRAAATTSFAAGLGAHQPDGRLHLAAEQAGRARQVPAATNACRSLAYDFFRFVS